MHPERTSGKAGREYDYLLLFVVLVLVVWGVVVVYSASSIKAAERFGESDFFLERQLWRVLLGLVLMAVVMRVDYRFLQRISPYLLLGAILALAVLLVSDQVQPIKGARRRLILQGFGFQPSDFARMSLLLYFSAYLVKIEDKLKSFTHGVLPPVFIMGMVGLLILLEPNLGTAALVMMVSLILLYLAGVRLWHLVLLSMAGGGIFFFFLQRVPYQRARLWQWFQSVRGLAEPSWQVKQSLIGLGQGGFFGVGLGNGRQKFHFLPEPFTDFIFSVVGEEVGLFGTALLLTLFLLLMWRGLRIALRAPDRPGRLLAAGITLSITLYAFFNAAVACNVLPTTGIPMPFISYGGSALTMNFLGVGVLLNISAQANDRDYVGNLYESYRPRRGR